MCRPLKVVVPVLSLCILGFVYADRSPRMIYVKDFVRTPGLLSEFGCPPDIDPDDLLRVGLYPIGLMIENNGKDPFVISGKTFQFPAINIPAVSYELFKKQIMPFRLTPMPLVNSFIIAACVAGCSQQLGFGSCKGINIPIALGAFAGGATYANFWLSRRLISDWLTRTSALQSRGGSVLVLPGNTYSCLLLLTRSVYQSAFPICFDSFPAHELQSIVHVSLSDNNADELKFQIYASDMPEKVKDELLKEAEYVANMPPGSQEAPSMRAYIEWVLGLPWDELAPEPESLEQARTILDGHHYGLADIKERVLDVIAMRMRKRDASPPIICLVGPPGTGKTSLARSIAECLGRPFERFSVGGVDDEADIRGHRRTYIGAIPGRIMTAIDNAGVKNPVILIDEIDKMGSGRSDAARAAILEVLDPEQNKNFRDHYLGLPFDCSQVFFIATANTLYDVPPALIDRMEIIQLSGYTLEEKVAIATDHLWKRAQVDVGLSDQPLQIDAATITYIINHYTDEAGIRELDRVIHQICMKASRLMLEGQHIAQVSKDVVEQMLGVVTMHQQDIAQQVDAVGIVNGLACISSGGTLFPVQVSLIAGSGKLILTGQLGKVMQESARIALSYVRRHAQRWNIPDSMFTNHNIHIHVPVGALKKDGPSGGVTLATALVSAFSGKLVACHYAMTGEIDLVGSVLRIGGLKEKVLAAQRNGIHAVIAPAANKIDAIKFQDQLTDIEIIWVDSIDQVLDLVLL